MALHPIDHAPDFEQTANMPTPTAIPAAIPDANADADADRGADRGADRDAPAPSPGALLARGVCRLLIDEGFAPMTEWAPTRGLRCDVAALGPKGEIWVVECKSGLPDFRADAKWQGYLPWCERFFFAVDDAFPDQILPQDHGLIRADAYGAGIMRMPAVRPLAAARRKALILRLARGAALRLRGMADPGARAFAAPQRVSPADAS
jgi:hypothetical protein